MLQINKDIDNTRLKNLLSKLKDQKTKEEQQMSLNMVAQEIAMNTKFVSVVQFSINPKKTADGEYIQQKGSKMSMPTLAAKDKKAFYPLFTDIEEMKKWKGQNELRTPDTVLLGFDDFANMILDRKIGDGFVINPFSDNFVVTKEVVAKWRENKQRIANIIHKHNEEAKAAEEQRIIDAAKAEMAKFENILIIEPTPYPKDIINSIVDTIKDNDDIVELWFMVKDVAGELSYVLIADINGDEQEIFAKIEENTKDFRSMPIEIYNRKDNFSKYCIAKVDSFYKIND